MLHILLLLLKIIGIVLLVILGIVVLALCAAFFVPLQYQGTASAEGTIESIKAEFKFSWLFHSFAGYLIYKEQKLEWQVRILWRKLNRGDKAAEDDERETAKDAIEEKSADDAESKGEKAKVEREKMTDLESESIDSEHEKTEGMKSESAKLENADSKNKESKAEKKSRASNSAISKQTEQKNQKKPNFIEKIKYTIRNFCDKIRLLIEKKEDLEKFLNDEIHRSAWTRLKTEVFRLLRFIKPRKLQLNLHFGFGDPSVTGKTLAALSMLYPFYGDHVRIVPDFENAIFEGDAFIKGKIHGIHAMRLAWSLFFDENIQTTYKRITNWKR